MRPLTANTRAVIRWVKFNVVGAMGMAVQLGALALLNRWMQGHYLIASAAALELTLLHNFMWHLHYTWRDRRGSGTRVRRFVRFHLANGMVSMVGNLVLMRILVHKARVPAVVANGVAILCCSVANFYLGNRWAFAEGRRAKPVSSISVPILILTLIVLLMSSTGHAQVSSSSAPDRGATGTAQPSGTAQQPSVSPQPRYNARPNDSYLTMRGAFCGAGASSSPVATKPTAGCGAGNTFLPLPVLLEVGLIAPQANRSHYSGYISVDSRIPLAPSSIKYVPSAIARHGRLFETGH